MQRKNPMRQPEDLPGFRFAVLEHQKPGAFKGRLVLASYDDQAEEMLAWIGAIPETTRNTLEALGLPKYANAPEEWAWSVGSTHAWADGWGPLMYEALLVLLAQKGYSGWLLNDSNCTSKEARAVWRKFADRSDVEFVELPTERRQPRFAMRALPALIKKRQALVNKPDTDKERKKLVLKFLKSRFKEGSSYNPSRKNPMRPQTPAGPGWIGPLYHGTKEGNFLEFIEKDRDAFFFTDSESVAFTYAGSRTSLPLPKFKSLKEFASFIDNQKANAEPYFIDFEKDETGHFEVFTSDTFEHLAVFEEESSFLRFVNDYFEKIKTPGIYSVFVLLENPLIVDGQGAVWDEINSKQLKKALKKHGIEESFEDLFVSTREIEELAEWHGFDGFIVEDIFDTGPNDHAIGDDGSSVYGVFDSRKIKSVQNKGTWDTSDPIITNPDETRELISLLEARNCLMQRKNPSRSSARIQYLFCYGSNSTRQLEARLGIPGGSRGQVQGAYAPDYQRVFRGMSSTWGGGTASLQKKKGAATYGLLVELSARDLDVLDRYEGVHSGVYKRQKLLVYTQDGEPVEAIAYVSLRKDFNPPTKEYLAAVVKTISRFWEGENGPVTAKDIPIR